ncbi:hypothetical protein JK358_27300 [Nocardia sp. 2]|uniref:Uncharacterized protein n=1 Tax=Nocardia acididurans TaxID=2802282 RepID=A0ABS1MBU3_9NOCA|nr:hypothetical protein [Nocardia acididurans]MBL1078118.1 hypothetical protein [Nocardia acididurans]
MFRRRKTDQREPSAAETPPPQGDNPEPHPPEEPGTGQRAKLVSTLIGKIRKDNERNRPRPRNDYHPQGGGPSIAG